MIIKDDNVIIGVGSMVGVGKPYTRRFDTQKNQERTKEILTVSQRKKIPKEPTQLASIQSSIAQSGENNSEIGTKNKLLHVITVSKSKVIYENSQHDLLDDLRKVSSVNGESVVILQTEKAERLIRILEGIQISDLISDANLADLFDTEPTEEKVPKLSAEEVQARRDEVREMAFKGKPKDGIPLYKGLRGGDRDAVSFFKEHYAPYIVPGQEVIFASDLSDIDSKLIDALRNQCRNGVVMPLGTKSDKTTAIINGLFFDGSMAARSARYKGIRQANTKQETVSSEHV
jgi:hypothetical protein